MSITNKLKLTMAEINHLINDSLPIEYEGRFEEIFNEIPFYHKDYVRVNGETHRCFIEDDHRERRWFIFQDKLTGEEYCLDYIMNPEWENDIGAIPENIEIVEVSNIISVPEPTFPPEPTLSLEEINDKHLMDLYHKLCTDFRIVDKKEKNVISSLDYEKITSLIKTKKFSIIDLRKLIVPICIENKIEHKSFWVWFQTKRGVWK